MFEFLEKIKNPSDEAMKRVCINIPIEYCLNDFTNAIFDENYTDDDIINKFQNYYEEFISEVANSDSGKYNNIIINERFLSLLYKLINIKPISEYTRINLCKIIYNYTLLFPNKEQIILSSLQSIAEVINKNYIVKLFKLFPLLDRSLPILLSVVRFSISDDIIAVVRLNKLIEKYPIHIMNEQTIVDIYSILFERFTPCFIGTMFDVDIPKGDLIETYDMISLSVLDILENMPLADIRIVLLGYYKEYWRRQQNKNNIIPVRFKMFTVNCSDYPRINSIVDQLNQVEHIAIP